VNDRLVVCYNNDNAFGELSGKSYWRLYKEAIPYYDLHLAYRDSDVPHFDNVRSHVLYPHNMPWLHRVLPENELAGWESDICFLGHFEPDRRKIELDTLMKNVPAHFRLHGSFWKENSKDMAWQGMDTRELQGEDYVRALNATKIALVFFSTWNADTFTRRVFEIPACGTMMLSQRTETMQGLYTEDKEAVYFDNADELVEKARFYLTHEDARKRIAEAGRLRCISSGYDIYSRMREWLSVVESMRSKASQ
jgi:spore maturation protein CgeB